MTDFTLSLIPPSDPQLRNALVFASLPTHDLEDDGRSFFALRDSVGAVVGYSGLEACGDDVLLRSMVIQPERRGEGIGRTLAELTIAKAAPGADVYLATTSAAPFFKTIGFDEVGRSYLPTAVLFTRQLSSLCPASATIMKLKRPPI
nr:arsenic resistance N-acetyltransferase ArsN2 [uncultured Rhizobium sp.]